MDGNDTSSDDDDDLDDDDEDENDNEAELLEEEEEPLNSEDDVSDSEHTDQFETDNVVVCQYDKVTMANITGAYLRVNTCTCMLYVNDISVLYRLYYLHYTTYTTLHYTHPEPVINRNLPCHRKSLNF